MKSIEVNTEPFWQKDKKPNSIIKRIDEMRFGVENRVFKVFVEINFEEKIYIVKESCVARFEYDSNVYKKQFIILSQLRTQGLPVPLVVDNYLDEQEKYAVLVYEYQDGDLSLPLNNVQILELIKFILKLHKTKLKHESDIHCYNKFYYHTGLQEMLVHESIIIRFFCAILASKLKILKPEDSSEYVLVHGDFHPGNIIWSNQDTIKSVIDWDTVGFGPKETDLAHYYINLLVLCETSISDFFLKEAETMIDINNSWLYFLICYESIYTLSRYCNWEDSYWGSCKKLPNHEIDRILINTFYNFSKRI